MKTCIGITDGLANYHIDGREVCQAEYLAVNAAVSAGNVVFQRRWLELSPETEGLSLEARWEFLFARLTPVMGCGVFPMKPLFQGDRRLITSEAILSKR